MMVGPLQVFCRFVRQPAAGHNLMGAIWKLASLAPRGDERACAALSDLDDHSDLAPELSCDPK